MKAANRKGDRSIFHARYPQSIDRYQRQFETTVLPAENGLANVFTKFRDNFSSFEIELVLELKTWEIKSVHLDSFQSPYGQCCHTVFEIFPNVVGLKGLPGFTKRLNEIIGRDQGCHHLVASLIETMRTGRQLAIVPHYLQHLLDFQNSLKMRQLDLLLFPNIENSCWAYSTENGLLVPGTGSTKLNSSMYPLEGFAHQPFMRKKTVTVIAEDDHFRCAVDMKDNVHEMTLELLVKPEEDLIVQTIARFNSFPYDGICENMATLVNQMEGSKINDHFREHVYNKIGGPKGCTHLVDFFLDLISLYPLLKDSNGSSDRELAPHTRELVLRRNPELKGSCCAF